VFDTGGRGGGGPGVGIRASQLEGM
jgi:hypothetical protein